MRPTEIYARTMDPTPRIRSVRCSRRSLVAGLLVVAFPFLVSGCEGGSPLPALAASMSHLAVGVVKGEAASPQAGSPESEQAIPEAGQGIPGAGPETPDHPVAPFLARPAPDSATVEWALEGLDDGLELWRSGERQQGARQVDRALALLPTLEDWRPLILAELLAADADTTGVRQALDGLDRTGEIHARWGWRFQVEALEAAGDSAGALRAALREADELQTVHPAHAAAVRVRGGALALALGDTTEARAQWIRALESAPTTDPAAGEAARRLDRLRGEIRDPRALELKALALAEHGAWAEARPHLETLLLRHTEGAPLGEEGPVRLRLALGRTLVELGRHDEATAVLTPLALTPGSETAAASAQALFWKGRAALARNRNGEAREHFLALVERDPENGPGLGEEGMLAILGQLGGSDGAASRAPAVADLFLAGVATPAGELVAVRHGTVHYLAGRYDQAARHFEAYEAAARRSATRQQAAYWAALAHDRLGDRDRAREFLYLTHRENPLSFYGALAGERLDAPVLPPDLTPGPEPTAARADAVRNAILRLRVHQRVPTSGSFAWELARLEAAFLDRGDEAYEFAEALLDGGLPIQGVVMGRAIHTRNGEWDLRLLRIVHPFPWRDAIVREARSRGLDPFFVAGLIRQESLFHPTIRSSAGAVGLMQLMPGTGREVAQAEGLRFSPAILEDPEMNIRLGTAFLASMVRRFDGRAEDALAAYNAGPTRARQWRERPEYRNVDVFREHIPFRETRHYVKVVHQYTRIYTALYGCGNFEPCLGLSYQAALARSPHGGGIPSTAVAR